MRVVAGSTPAGPTNFLGNTVYMKACSSMVERLVYTEDVVGSIPTRLTKRPAIRAGTTMVAA